MFKTIEYKSAAAAPLMTKTKSLDFQVKSVDEEKNIFEGYASTFGGDPDAHGDIIEKGAFAKTIQERKDRVKILWQHNWDQPIGKAIELREDDHGLYLKAKISDTTLGREVMTLIKDGVIDRLSIGYSVVREEYDREKRARILKEVKLYEVSPVTFPANDRAIISGAKHNGVDADIALKTYIDQVIDEVKAGRMLSEKTKQAITSSIEAMKSAIQSLEDLLAAAQASEGAGSDNNSGDNQKSSFLAEEQKEILNLVEEMKQFAAKGG
jgi:uncharacterized protein